jgi:hypothetical protein
VSTAGFFQVQAAAEAEPSRKKKPTVRANRSPIPVEVGPQERPAQLDARPLGWGSAAPRRTSSFVV